MFRPRVLGTQPIRTPHTTLVECVSVWVDAFGRHGKCTRYTHASVISRRGVSSGAKAAGPHSLTKPLIRPRKRYPLIRDDVRTSQTREDFRVPISLRPKPTRPPPLPVPPRPPDPEESFRTNAAHITPYADLDEDDFITVRPATFPEEALVDDIHLGQPSWRSTVDVPDADSPTHMIQDEDLPHIKLEKIFSRRFMESPTESLPTPHNLKSLWRSARDDGALYLLGPDTLSSAAALFGTLSVMASPLPGHKFYSSPSVDTYEGAFYAPHPLAKYLISKNNGRTHWNFVRMALRDQGAITKLLSTPRDLFWLMMSYLAEAQGLPVSSRKRKIAMQEALKQLGQIEKPASRHFYLPYIHGMMSLPSTPNNRRSPVNSLIKLIQKEEERADELPLHSSVRAVLWELLRRCWITADTKTAQLLVEAAYLRQPILRMEQWSPSSHLQGVYNIPTLYQLYEFLFAALHRDFRRPKELGVYERLTILWAANEIQKGLSDVSKASSNLAVLLLPAVPDFHTKYVVGLDDRLRGSSTLEPISTVGMWAIVCGLKTLDAVPLEARPDRFGEVRDQLWSSWITMISSGGPPIIHFAILVSFLSLAQSEDDATFLSNAFDWLFSGRTGLYFPSDSAEAMEWRTELSIAALRAMAACGDASKRDVKQVFQRISRLQKDAPKRMTLVFNRALAMSLEDHLTAASRLFNLALRFKIRLWPVTLLSYFHVNLAERRISAIVPYFRSLRLARSQRVHFAKSWVWNVARNPSPRWPLSMWPDGHAFRRAMSYAVRDKSNPLPASTWRAALKLFVQAHLPLVAAQMAARIADLGGYRLRDVLPRSAIRIITRMGSKQSKRQFRAIIRTLRKEPMIDRSSGLVNPDVVYMARKGGYFEETRLLIRMTRQGAKASPALVNIFLTRGLRGVQRTMQRNHIHTWDPRYIIRLIRRIQKSVMGGRWLVGDPVTANILFKAMVRWDALISSTELQHLFDSVFVMGYPGCERFPKGLFGTLSGEGDAQRNNFSIHPLRHAIPLYRTFVRGFRRRGDWAAARKVVTLFDDATRAQKEALVERQAARREGRLRAKTLAAEVHE